MEAARKAIEESKAVTVWDEDSQQYYAEYTKDGAKYKIWLEDASSIDLRSSLVLKYNIAGAAAWRLDFETKDIWEVLGRNLKTVSSYEEWEKAGRKYVQNSSN
jgi:spore germination protein YaaH